MILRCSDVVLVILFFLLRFVDASCKKNKITSGHFLCVVVGLAFSCVGLFFPFGSLSSDVVVVLTLMFRSPDVACRSCLLPPLVAATHQDLRDLSDSRWGVSCQGKKVTTVLAIRMGNKGEGGSPPGEQTPRKRGSPKTQKVCFKGNTDARESVPRRGS